MIWTVLLTITILSALWLVFPFLKTTVLDGSGDDAAVSIYGDQEAEVDRDLKGGLISTGEAQAALKEIAWRKGQDVLLDALVSLEARRSPAAAPIAVWLAGAGPERLALLSRIAAS